MEEVKWYSFNYRVRHSTIPLHPLMLEANYQLRIDGKLVTFDRDYIIWRICSLLHDVYSKHPEEVEAICKELPGSLERFGRIK